MGTTKEKIGFVRIEIGADEHARLKQAAKRNDMSVAAFVRRTVRQAVERDDARAEKEVAQRRPRG